MNGQADLFAASPSTGAVFSPCRAWRYELHRSIGDGPALLFVMLNPSTADEQANDPTITRCIGFARRWGFGSLAIGNLFAWRSTDPKILHSVADPVGPENDAALARMARRASKVVVAWGANAEKVRPGRAAEVVRLLERETYALHVNADGSPKHPLYVASTAVLVPYAARGAL